MILSADGKPPTYLTNAAIIGREFVRCDTPSLLNKQGYAMDVEGTTFNVYITLDGGSQLSDSMGKFTYLADPIIYEMSPALGPEQGGTVVTVNGTGFDQNNTCGIIVRLGIVEFRPTSITNESMTFTTPNSSHPGTAVLSVSLNG